MKMRKLLCLVMAVVMLVGCFAACGKTTNAMNVVAEKESAGEEVIQSDEFFKNANYTAVDTQSKALMEVSSGTADGCVVDYVCSIGMIGEGTDYANLSVVEKYAFNDEQYGIAFRKGSTKTVAVVNAAINELIANGKLAEIAKKYKLDGQLDTNLAPIPAEDTLDTADWDYIKAKGTLVIGITYFEPMNYLDDNNELTGFETEFAKAVCETIGVTPVFQEISWNSKEMELSSKSIDCIWNGLTITQDRQDTMEISKPYMNNKQVLVVKSENVDKF